MGCTGWTSGSARGIRTPLPDAVAAARFSDLPLVRRSRNGHAVRRSPSAMGPPARYHRSVATRRWHARTKLARRNEWGWRKHEAVSDGRTFAGRVGLVPVSVRWQPALPRVERSLDATEACQGSDRGFDGGLSRHRVTTPAPSTARSCPRGARADDPAAARTSAASGGCGPAGHDAGQRRWTLIAWTP